MRKTGVVALVATGAILTVVAAGCGGAAAPSSAAIRGPLPVVATALWSLQQAAEQIGGTAAVVDNVVPPGANPLTYGLPASSVRSVREATVALVAGGGLQPTFAAAASDVPHLVDVHDTVGPYAWLDPTAMVKVVSSVASTMGQAEPAAASEYRNNAEGFNAEVSSTGIDYQSVLSTCPRRTIFTADDAFMTMAQDNDLTNVVLGTDPDPSPSTVAALAARVEAAGATTVFSEPWVSDVTVEAVAAAAHVKVSELDTLLGPPPGGWPPGANYINLLESNLGALNSALGCPQQGTDS